MVVDRDECDACPHDAHVQAFVYASREDWPASLAYCAHHGGRFMDRLVELDAHVIDMRHLLAP